MPLTSASSPGIESRGILSYWAKQLSGLPGDFTFPIFNSRLHASLSHFPGTIPQPDQIGGAPEVAVYETLDSPRKFLACLRELQKFNLLDPTGSKVSQFALRLTINLYANAYAGFGATVISLPDAEDAYRGEHSIYVFGLHDSNLIFRHNWDDWSADWSMPVSYVDQEFVEASYMGRLRAGDERTVPEEQFEARSLSEPPSSFELSKSVADLSPPGALVRIVASSGVSVSGMDQFFQFLACTDVGGKLPVSGWAFFRSTPEQRLTLEEVFVHPAFRRFGIATTLVGTAAFYFHMASRREVQLLRTRADITVNRVVPDALVNPGWLRGGWSHRQLTYPRQTVQRDVQVVSTLKLLEAAVMRDARSEVAARGIVTIEDLTIYPDESQRGRPSMGVVVNPAQARRAYPAHGV